MYDSADRLVSRGGQAYDYDTNGNELSDGAGNTYAYDLARNRTSTTGLQGTTTYGYSGDGLALSSASGGVTTSWAWDENMGLPQLAERTSGSQRTSSVYGLARISSRIADGSDQYYHYDAIGSVTGVTNGAGSTQHTYDWDPFGVARSHTSALGAQPNGFGFTGEYSEPDSGLNYMRARWYEPASGRFTATDPLERDASQPWQSPYAYADGRPGVLVDPSGESAADVLNAVAGTIGEVPHVLASGQSLEFLANEGRGAADALLLGHAGVLGINTQCLGVAGIVGGVLSFGIGGAEEGAGRAGALAEHEIATVTEGILAAATGTKVSAVIQISQSGGLAQATADFDALTHGVVITDQGRGISSATLSNGTQVTVRPGGGGGPASLDLRTPGNPVIKIGY